MRTRTILAATSLVLAATALTACGKHYRVTEPASGAVYYTRDVDRYKGFVEFEDALTGDDVMLESSEVRTISKREYRENVPRN